MNERVVLYDVVMPKRSTRNLRESRIGKRVESCKIATADVIVKQIRSINVNVKNAKRWFMMKKRLSLVTDDELVSYLLDLAEPIIRRDGKCSRAEDWKTDQDKENDLEVIKIDDKDLLNVEEPLRRSPRKQCIVPVVSAEPVVVVVESTDVKKSPQCTNRSEIVEPKNEEPRVEKRRSRIKHHHKTKEKHHREKRTKRKHSKNNNDDETNLLIENDEKTVLSRINVDTPESDGSSNNHDIRLSPVLPKIIVERLSLNEKEPIIVRATREDKKNSILAENLNKNKRNRPKIDNEKLTTNRNFEKDTGVEKMTDLLKNHVYDDSNDVDNDNFDISNVSTKNELPCVDNLPTPENRDDTVKEEKSLIVSTKRKPVDERRSRKKRKHGKHDSSLEKDDEHVSKDETNDNTETTEVIRKHRKKKHKRDSSTTRRTKKYHDVRKAPQDGLVENPTIVDEIVNETTKNDNICDPLIVETTNVKSSCVQDTIMITEVSEPQRLAIKIKLCQECNDRHIKDSCPLTLTDNHIKDRLSYGDWLTRHSSNVDVTKAIASVDPIAEGYVIANDDNDESDDDTGNSEHAKNKMKIESEDKQLYVNDDRPLYSRDSLPDCFELRITTPEHGIGIYAVHSLPIYAKFGPLVGNIIREMDIPDDFSMRHLWEIENDGKTTYLSTTNPLKSNWIRYMRPADNKDDRNVTVVTKNGELYLVTTRNIVKGTELTYWADSQSSAWTRKNKIDKTNCGGCNLNFTHSIYYRLHCCIFHDTRYSLTIRKYHCKVCGAAVLGKDNIMKHAADLHGGRGAYQCQYCRKFFLRLNYLEMHRTYGCSQNPQRSRPLCDFCGRKFCQPQKLKVHIKRMHSDMSEVLREFQCKLCMKLLGSRAALQRHMKEVHHKDVVGAATCDRCGKMFQNKSNLKIHMLTHSGVKPFKCKEHDCKAAFTTKQCLQFHYKKVHGLSEDMMPKIERSVAYTFDAYSGGLVEAIDREKTPRSERRGSQENSNSAISLDDYSSEHSSRADVSMSSFQPSMSEFVSAGVTTSRYNLDRYILDREEQDNDFQEREIRDSDLQDSDLHDREMQHREMQHRELQEREMHEREMYKREIQDHEKQEREMQEREIQEREIQEREIQKREMQEREMQEREIQEREMQEREMRERALQDREIKESSPSPVPSHSHQDHQMSNNDSSLENDRPSSEVDFYGTRLQSKGSKKWMGQYNNINEQEIMNQHHNDVTARSDVYEFDDTSIKKNDDRNEVVTTSNNLMSGSKLGLNIYRRSESTNASLLVEAALDAAERDIGTVTSPIIDDNDRETNIYTITGQLQNRQNDGHLDSYIQQQDELMSSSPTTQDNRKTPTSHPQIDYHLHRPIDYINSPRTHVIEQYLPADELSRVVSPSGYNIHMQQDDLNSPSTTPDQNRYQEIHHHHHHHQQQQQQQHHHQQHHHHQVTTDNLSSDEGDSVAQNLSISVKEKSLQLDLSTNYKYEQLDTEFNRDRGNFEPLVINNGELQGLDMSARGFHHTLATPITNNRYHHHLYELTERQSVDLSRTAGYTISPPPSTAIPPPPPPPPPPPATPAYPHGEVLRIVSLDLTPGHSVDLSLSRSHHLHGNGNRLVTCSPQPPGSSNSHVVPDNVEGRILSSPPPSITGYNATYPVSPAPYHPPRPGYHHYSGYY